MNDMVAGKLALMGIDRLMPINELSLVFFKMTVADRVGLVVALDCDLTENNLALLKKMAAAFNANLQSSSNIEFDYSYVWLLGSDIANKLSGNNFDLEKWLSGKHMASDKPLFVYPTLRETAANSSYKSFIWRSFSEYIK